MPTRDGDVVVSQLDGAEFLVWHVLHDGQQQPSPGEKAAPAVMGRPTALALGRIMARASRGTVFFVEQDIVTWTKLPN
jgi:hypothetical protein